MATEWIWGLAGGLIIGLAAAIFLLANGRIMGASGLLGGLVDGSGRGNQNETLWFLAGLVVVPMEIAHGIGFAPPTHATDNVFLLISAGLLVGIGTRLANGCTSGHGVCGISRFSLRGIVATAFYIGAGGLTVAVFHTLLGVI